MDKFVVASLRQSAGKTSVIIGIAKALNRKFGYIKPFGERFLYRKKRLWDYDAALITNIFGLEENPENMSVGFHHSKLLYMLNKDSAREKICELLVSVGEGKDIFFAECGKDITYGVSVHLDALTVARDIGAQLVMITNGEEDTILDDVLFFKNYVQMDDIRCKGIIINKVVNVTDFCDTRLPRIQQQGIDVLGVIPYYKELASYSVGYLADRLFAKIITGEDKLNRTVRNVFIGSMFADAALTKSSFLQEGNVVITSSERNDVIVAALEKKAAAIILTNEIYPPPDLMSKASQSDIPLLLVSADAYEIANQIEEMEPLPTKDDREKIALMEQMVRTHVDLEALMRP